MQTIVIIGAAAALGLLLFYFLGTDAGLRRLSNFLSGTGLKGGG